mgnify:CR=1 FL=1
MSERIGVIKSDAEKLKKRLEAWALEHGMDKISHMTFWAYDHCFIAM